MPAEQLSPEPPKPPQARGFRASPGGTVTVLVPDTFDDLITITEAADDLGCDVSTISRWVKAGHIKPADARGKRLLFKRIDVLRAERDRRRNALGRRAG